MSASAPPCRYLRARSSYGRPPEGRAPDEAGAATLEAYWCLVTMEPAGPDDAVADAGACRPGRACYATRDGGGPLS